MKKRILITDDDLGIQDVLRCILEMAGYEVMITDSGDKILENCYELPHIYLLDKQMAGMDGADLCKRLKSAESTKGIPVIMVSATPGLGPIALSAGADDFLEKPFQRKELLQKLENLLK
ncbi:MAG: response regulator [Williamsia sp.]|nr:response regulator [Williamsia sp.]